MDRLLLKAAYWAAASQNKDACTCTDRTMTNRMRQTPYRNDGLRQAGQDGHGEGLKFGHAPGHQHQGYCKTLWHVVHLEYVRVRVGACASVCVCVRLRVYQVDPHIE